MKRHPCPTPHLCGVTYHRDPSNCLSSRLGIKSTNGISAPPPSLVLQNDGERSAYIAMGGGIRDDYINGVKIEEEWRDSDDILHREGGPALQQWSEEGVPKLVEWWRNDEWHREDGPARIFYHENGKPKSEEWFVNGENHRCDGPAFQSWDPDGKDVNRYWYLEGVMYPETQIDRFWREAVPYLRSAHPEFADMPDEWMIEYYKGQWS